MSQIRLTELASDPETPVEDNGKRTGVLYVKDVAGELKPFLKDSDAVVDDFEGAIGPVGPIGPAGPSAQIVSVADITNPVELATKSSPSQGDLLTAVQVGAGSDKGSLYTWDITSNVAEDIPRTINGVEPGQWVLVATSVPDLLKRNAVGTTIDTIPVATFNTVQDMIDTMQSIGVITGIEISDNGNGTINISAGTGTIRTTNSDTGRLVFFDIAESLNIPIAEDGNIKFVYIEYNAGSPQFVIGAERADLNTNVQISRLFREDLETHVHQTLKFRSVNTNFLISKRLFETEPFKRASGARISATGTRNFAVTEGSFWECLNPFITSAFDSSGVDNYDAYYKSGATSFTKIASQSQIDNLQYNDTVLNTLVELANNQYGVHWIYIESDSNVVVLFGEASYTLQGANDAAEPAARPKRLDTHGKLLGKIIIQKSAAVFTAILSVFDQAFETSSPTDHNNLVNLQGGTGNEYFHLTNAEYNRFQNAQAEKTARSALAALEIDFAGDSIKTKTIGAASVFTFAGISATTLDRVITLEMTGDFGITLPVSVQNRTQVQDAYDGTKTNWLFFNVVDATTPKVVATIIVGD